MKPRQRPTSTQLNWVLLSSLIVCLVAALFGYTEIAPAHAQPIAKVVLFVAAAAFLVTLIFRLVARGLELLMPPD